MKAFLAIADVNGHVDIRGGLPKGYVHVLEPKAHSICRKLGIRCAFAMTGVDGPTTDPKPVLNGVVICARSFGKVRASIQEQQGTTVVANTLEAKAKRELRATKRRKKREAKLRKKLRAAGLLAAGQRTQEAYLDGYYTKYEAQLVAFKCEYRHSHTDYEDQFEFISEEDRTLRVQEARQIAVDDPFPDEWPDYLRQYGLSSPVAVAMTKVLREPTNCHPVWFKACELGLLQAIENGKAIGLTTLTYEIIRDHKLINK